ncbi:hypothetical protein HYH03_004408 [Edaphochlamys debaryana]|uniref:3'-5' exonuclease domain-containing protein n=1 Tax=Edaphochlamys debaryana TaxID=47281 RepID=A0A835Y9L6_9CHLO|nr:hypothetical protein HYH03_004408 [Edaphochlamys debaryana]|eukprot:KAG2497669.1 hypothetical protein HYH03_004408 [Edaphochlamys debaryana]
MHPPAAHANSDNGVSRGSSSRDRDGDGGPRPAPVPSSSSSSASRPAPPPAPGRPPAAQPQPPARRPPTNTGRSGGRRPATDSSAHAAPLAPPPAPPPSPPDHTHGGYSLVSSVSDLERMLDQLVTAAPPAPTAAVAGLTAAAAAASRGGGGGAGRGSSATAALAPKPSNSSSNNSNSNSSSAGNCAASVGSLAIDCEGRNLGDPEGKLCLLQLAARCGGSAGGGGGGGGRGGGAVSIWLVDVEALGPRAFSTRSRLRADVSLRALLQDPAVPKYLYDVRSDAAAMAREYGVRLRGVVDLQLADVAIRQAEGEAGSWVEGLLRCLSRRLAAGGRASAPPRLARDVAAAAATARRYHEGGNTQVWEQRPLTEELCEYAAADVRHLHALADVMAPKIGPALAERVAVETVRRMTQWSPNTRDAKAAAPQMLPRRGQAAAAAGTGGGGEGAAAAGGAGAAAGAGAGSEGPGGAGYASGLMEWLVAALLVQYDKGDVTAPHVVPDGTAQRDGSQDEHASEAPPALAAAVPEARGGAEAGSGPVPGTAGGEGDGPDLTAEPEAAPPTGVEVSALALAPGPEAPAAADALDAAAAPEAAETPAGALEAGAMAPAATAPAAEGHDPLGPLAAESAVESAAGMEQPSSTDIDAERARREGEEEAPSHTGAQPAGGTTRGAEPPVVSAAWSAAAAASAAGAALARLRAAPAAASSTAAAVASKPVLAPPALQRPSLQRPTAQRPAPPPSEPAGGLVRPLRPSAPESASAAEAAAAAPAPPPMPTMSAAEASAAAAAAAATLARLRAAAAAAAAGLNAAPTASASRQPPAATPAAAAAAAAGRAAISRPLAPAGPSLVIPSRECLQWAEQCLLVSTEGVGGEGSAEGWAEGGDAAARWLRRAEAALAARAGAGGGGMTAAGRREPGLRWLLPSR